MLPGLRWMRSPLRAGKRFAKCASQGRRILSSERAFTLIELLVVIAVIVVLAALLFPALGRAKIQAHRVDCLNRMRQWTMAFTQYADDNEGWIPREGYHTNGETFLNNWGQVYDADSRDVWYNCLEKYVGRPPASSYSWPPKHRLDIYRPASFFQCPVARIPDEVLDPNYLFALFSVAMNSKLIEPPHVPSTKVNRIRRQSQTVLYLDSLVGNEELVFTNQAYAARGQPAAYANRFAGKRHGNGGNLSFADGHAETKKGAQVVSQDGWDIYPPKNVFWYIEE